MKLFQELRKTWDVLKIEIGYDKTRMCIILCLLVITSPLILIALIFDTVETMLVNLLKWLFHSKWCSLFGHDWYYSDKAVSTVEGPEFVAVWKNNLDIIPARYCKNCKIVELATHNPEFWMSLPNTAMVMSRSEHIKMKTIDQEIERDITYFPPKNKKYRSIDDQ